VGNAAAFLLSPLASAITGAYSGTGLPHVAHCLWGRPPSDQAPCSIGHLLRVNAPWPLAAGCWLE
jgi:hypothetical protein